MLRPWSFPLNRHISFYIENYIVKNILRGVTDPDILLSVSMLSSILQFKSGNMQTLYININSKYSKILLMSNIKREGFQYKNSTKMQEICLIFFLNIYIFKILILMDAGLPSDFSTGRFIRLQIAIHRHNPPLSCCWLPALIVGRSLLSPRQRSREGM